MSGLTLAKYYDGWDIDMVDNETCEGCGQPLDPERGHAAPVCDDECLHDVYDRDDLYDRIFWSDQQTYSTQDEEDNV